MTSGGPPENALVAVTTVREFFASGPFDVTEEHADGVVNFHYTAEGPAPTIVTAVYVDTERFVTHFSYEERIPRERSPEVTLFLMLANWGLAVGNFELNLRTGLLRFKTGIDFTATPL